MIIVYILLLAVSGLFYIQYEGAISFYLFCFVAAYPLIFGTMTFIAKRKIKVSFEAKEISALKGENVPVNVIVDNKSRLPVPNCRITIRCSTEFNGDYEIININTPVFPNNTQVLTTGISYGHYGSIRLDITKVKISDILRIFKFKVKRKNMLHTTRLFIYPNHIPLENTINDYSELGLESESYSKSKSGDDPSEIFDLHNYKEGDKMSRIHWKLSAKQDDLMVKDYSLPITNGVLLAADLSHIGSSSEDLEKLDAVVDAMAAISLRLAESETVHTVIWDSSGTEDYGKAVISDFESYTTAVRRFISDGLKGTERSVCELIADISAGVPRFAHTIICTAGLSDEEKKALTDSGYSYRYTAIVASEAHEGYEEENFCFVPLAPGAVAESIEYIAI